MTHAKTHGCSEATKSAAKKAAKKALGNKKRPRPEPLGVNCKQVLHRPDELARLIGQVPLRSTSQQGFLKTNSTLIGNCLRFCCLCTWPGISSETSARTNSSPVPGNMIFRVPANGR